MSRVRERDKPRPHLAFFLLIWYQFYFYSYMCVLLQNFQPLSSAYGLAKHRDGRWEWAIAPGVSPSPRYQHAAVSCCLFCLNFF
jgi:hypothetical protein